MATKKELIATIEELEAKFDGLVSSGSNASGFHKKDFKAFNVKPLKDYVAELSIIIDDMEVEALVHDDTDGDEQPPETAKTVVEEEEGEEDTYVPLEKTQETVLVECAINTELFSGSLWAQTGRVISSQSGQFKMVDKKKMAEAFNGLLNKNVDPALIPEQGPDREGNIINLRKKSGAVKWSSWEKTARMLQNTSTIFKGIEGLGYEVVFPNGFIIPRNQLERLLKDLPSDKPPEPAVQTIKRCLEMAAKKMPEIEDLAELIDCDPFLKDVVEQFKEALELLKQKSNDKDS